MSAFSISMNDANNKIKWADDSVFRSTRGRESFNVRKSPERNLNTVQQFFADLKNPQDLCGAMRPLLLVSFLVGLSPFRTVGSQGDRHLETTAFGVINTVSHMVFFCTCYVVRVINQESLVAHFFHSKVSRFGEDSQILTSFMAIAFTLILCFLKRDKLRQLFRVLVKIDQNLNHLGAKLDYKMVSRIVLISLCIQWLLFSIFVGVSFLVARSLEDQPDFFEWMFFFLPIAITSTLKVQFYCMMQLIKYRFRYINLVLNNLHEDQMNGTTFGSRNKIAVYNCFGIKCDTKKLNGGTGMKRDKCDIICQLCILHEELCDACYLAEEYFSHQMLTTVTIEFICTLFNLYFMFEVVYNNTTIAEVDTIEFLFYFGIYTLISIGSVYAILRSAETVAEENEKCAIYVHKLLNVLPRTENDIRELLMRLSMQLLHRKIKFTASGLFPLDSTLIFTMVGAATTYLIILFQVGNSIK